MRVLRPWFFLARVQLIPLERSAQRNVDDGLDVRKASREELLKATLELPAHLDVNFVEAALERGDICAAAFDGDKMVGFIWASFTTAPHGDGLWVAIEHPYVYGYKSFVREDYRGRRLLSRLADERDRASLGRGRVFNLGFIETHNFASHQAGIHAGGEDIGYVGYFRLFGKSYPFRSPEIRNTPLRFYRFNDPSETAS